MSGMRELYDSAKSDKWLKGFAVFCRIALAAGFIPSGLTKIMGERFAAGLSHNNPLGHYFDALYLTGYYYTFIGITQIVIAVLLLFPKTSLLGALMYFPVIINICVLTYATRFDGTRLVTMMVLANLFLLVWNHDRLQYIFGFPSPAVDPLPATIKPLSKRQRFIFFGTVFAVIAFTVIGTFYLYEIVPGNSEEECRNQCTTSKDPAACEVFCDCIYKQGNPLDTCLAKYKQEKKLRELDTK